MSKRQEIRARRRNAQIRNRIIVILLVTAGALLIVFALVIPSINRAGAIKAAGTAITPIATRAFTTKVDGLHLGDPNAPVKIDVWEDFQCSACLDYTKTIEPDIVTNQIETGKVYYTYHFFLIIDQGDPNGESHKAAEAAMCANEQGHFWDYHDILVANWLGENAGSYTDTRLQTMAQDVNLDMTAFNTCYQSHKYENQITQDMAAGQAKNVTGTPSVFVNGTILTPGQIPSYNDISQAVDKAISGQ